MMSSKLDDYKTISNFLLSVETQLQYHIFHQNWKLKVGR